MIGTKTAITFLIIFTSLMPSSLMAGEKKAPETMVYLGMGKADKMEISDHLLAIAEKQLRKDVQMRPYSVVDLLESGYIDIDDLVARLRGPGDKDKNEVKGTDSDGDVTKPKKDMEIKIEDWEAKVQLLKDAQLAFSLFLTKFAIHMDPDKQKASVEMAAGLEIYELSFQEDKPPTYKLLTTIVKNVPVQVEGGLREQGALDQQMAPIVRKAADQVGKYLGMQLRKLPQFQAQAKVKSGSAHMLVIPMGKNLGVGLDDAFDIMRKGENGQPERVAWAKIRKVEKESSQAEVILSDSDWTFSGDEIAVEDEISAVALKASAIMETSTGDILDRSGPGVYPGGELSVWVDVAESVGIPEMHLTVNLDFMDLGLSRDPAIRVLLGHLTIGLAKRWTFHRLALWFGMRAGASYYLYSESSLQTQQDTAVAAAHLGFGGDAVFGLDFRLIKHLSLFANIGGRIFSNPIDWLKSSHMDAGGLANIGLAVDF